MTETARHAMTALPEIPPSDIDGIADLADVGWTSYSADAMRAYGESCRIAGMEAAAVIAESSDLLSTATKHTIAAAIRAAAKEPK
jgi:hypothetical protein